MTGSGLVLALPPGRVAWDLDAVRSDPTATAEPPWRLEFEPDWSKGELLRLLTGGFDDGSALAVAGWRPRAAAGHDADAVVGLLAGPDGVALELDEVLWSVELDQAGDVRRTGLELYAGDDPVPVRVAGDAVDGEGELRLSMGGVAGRGRIKTLRPS